MPSTRPLEVEKTGAVSPIVPLLCIDDLLTIRRATCLALGPSRKDHHVPVLEDWWRLLPSQVGFLFHIEELAVRCPCRRHRQNRTRRNLRAKRSQHREWSDQRSAKTTHFRQECRPSSLAVHSLALLLLDRLRLPAAPILTHCAIQPEAERAATAIARRASAPGRRCGSSKVRGQLRRKRD